MISVGSRNACMRAGARSLVRALFAGSALLLLNGGFGAPSARAQSPAAAPQGQPADALKSAFDALPEAERRAIQEALVWTGDYKGVIDGVLGRGGREALAAYARRAKTAPEALLADARRKQLLAEAQKLRSAAGFRAVADGRSGASIAFPAAIFTRRADAPTGARWSNAAGSASLETFRDDGDLPALFERLRAPAPGRKIAYSVLRPDFLVVSGEDQRGMFYTRAARAEAAGKPATRGYTLVYARALQPSFETFAIAISNGFQPFASAPAAGQVATSGEPAPVAPPPRRRMVEATAIALGPDRALTSLSRDCPDMRVGDRPAKIAGRDPESGLALLETQGLRAALVRPATRAPGADVEVFALFAAQAGAGASVSLAPGRLLAPASAGAPWRVSAAVQDGVGGAAIFDRSGAWIGVVAQPPQEPRRIAGVIPQAAWRLTPSAQILAFLSAANVKVETSDAAAGDRSAGEVAGANAAALLAVSCLR